MLNQTLYNRYTITSPIGSGAMGTVYRATDSQTGEEVAVKVLNRELAFSPELLERFRREGEALRQLRHPNIVGLVDTFQHEGQQIIVMEYVAGGSLHSLIKQGPLPVDRARKIALGLCDALTRAHDLGIIHRDIKPENILVAADGTPKLTDFGIARLLTEGTRITQSGVQVGTPFYMSPEAWEGKPLDAQADIWSLGIVLFEMLAGEVPFPGDTVIAVMHKVLTAPLPELKQARPDTPEGLAQIVRRMMTRDKAERYPSMRQVAADLERGFPTAIPEPVVAKPTKPARRTTLWIATAVGVLAILALAAWPAIFGTSAGSTKPTTAVGLTAATGVGKKVTSTVVVLTQTNQSEAPPTTGGTATSPSITSSATATTAASAATPMTITSEPRILFDETHDGHLTLDLGRAEAIPGEPGWFYAGEMARLVRQDYVLDQWTEGPIVAEALSTYRVLILGAPTGWFGTQEIQTIDNFVSSGGRLLVFGDATMGSLISRVLDPMGVRLADGPIASQVSLNDAQSFDVSVNADDPVLARISRMQMNWSAYMEVDDPANVILWTGENTWLDSDSDGIQDSSEKVGPFPIVARIQYGLGWIIVISDNAFADGTAHYTGQTQIALQALEWLMGQ